MITMDDLDHSMRISDHDWLRFFEESEEGCRLKPSLACPDSSGLSDGDDLDFPSYTFIPLSGMVQQAEKDCKDPLVMEEVSSVLCSAEDASKVEPVSSNVKFEPEHLVTKYALSNDSPPQYRETVPGPVVKKKRKQKKIWKDKHKDCKSHTRNTDMIMQLKGPEELFLVTNKTSFEMLCKGDNSQLKLRGGSCDDMNQLLSHGTETIQELSSELHSIEQSKDLESLEASNEDDKLHVAIENKMEQRIKINCDAGFDIRKCTETPDTAFLQEKDTGLGHKRSPTKLTMDLTCIGDSKLEDNMNTCKSTKRCFVLDITNQADFELVQEDDGNQRRLKELNVDMKCLEKNILCQSATENARNTDFRTTHKNFSDEKIGNERNKQDNMGYIRASSKEDLLDLARENAEQGVDTVKSTVNPDSRSNSIESDEFADVEFFSSSSHDSEAYHSASESIENPLHLSIQNSPCHLPININDDSLADRGMDSSLQRESRPSRIETSQIFPSAHPGADNMPNDNTACNEGTEGTAPSLSVDTPTSAGNSSNSLAPGSLLQIDVAMESPEAYAKATGNNQPVYAISAFWDEMEKLTINDILQIRTGRCMLPIEESLNTNELVSSSCDGKNPTSIIKSSILDTMDTADSDYYTNLDESKPDRSSCDFSTSDFEEEYWQFINSSRPSSPDQHDKSYNSQCTDYVSTGEEESDEMGTPVPSENGSGGKWSCGLDFASYDVTVSHQMRKTKSMYDVHAVKTIDDLSSQTFLDRSSCKSLEESLNMSDGFGLVTPVMCHADEQYQISFPKVFEYLFDDNKAKCDALSVNVYGLPGSSILPDQPINNYTFCTIMDFPLSFYSVEPIPIFSCSRPTVRELTFLKQGGIFLGAKYTAMKDVSPIQIISQSVIKSMDFKETDRAFCFSQDLSSLYSVKNICFLDKGSDVWRYACEDKEKQEDAVDSSFTVVGKGGLVSMTPQMFKETTLRQISMGNQMPSDQGIFSTFKQSDMCLVCIAFASWVLRSSDPEAADAWKAALLANVSALSAIQYLRQYMKKKAAPQDD